MKFSQNEIIYLLTLVYFVVCAPFAFLWSQEDNFRERAALSVEEGRNESSTPRTFVLPANTAVAFEQARKKKALNSNIHFEYCALRLHDLGFDISNIDDLSSHRIMSKTLKYQFQNNLTPSGHFDQSTRRSLGC